MIEKIDEKYCLFCDVCGEEAEEQFPDFYGAIGYKAREGWKSQCRNGEWEDVCRECIKNP